MKVSVSASRALSCGRQRVLPYQLPWRRGALPVLALSDINVRDTSLAEALNSPLFTAIRAGDILADDHVGGCVLYEKRDRVEQLLFTRK